MKTSSLRLISRRNQCKEYKYEENFNEVIQFNPYKRIKERERMRVCNECINKKKLEMIENISFLSSWKWIKNFVQAFHKNKYKR